MIRKAVNLTIIVSFFLTTLCPLPKAHANPVLGLPAPGTRVNLSPAYEPVIIKGLTVHKDNPFLFDFIVDVGQDRMSGELLKKEGEKLIKYFLASLAIPDKDLWVNLSPYEKNKIIPEALGQTDMGRDLLEQDYILKQITASLIYPEKQLGKTFWDKVYAKARQMYGTTQVPVNTFNKVWITADKAEVFERNQTVFVLKCHFKVMLEEDYLALTKHQRQPAPQGNNPHAVASQIIKEIILPQLEREVNTGKNFANLRQIFNSIILSSWYKRNLKEALLNQVYANKAMVKGIDLSDPTIKQQIYDQYLKAYKKGVFNYIKKDMDAAGAAFPRKYFSGGILAPGAATHAVENNDLAALNQAMTADQLEDFATLAITKQSLTQVRELLPKISSQYGLRAINEVNAAMSNSDDPKKRVSFIDALSANPLSSRNEYGSKRLRENGTREILFRPGKYIVKIEEKYFRLEIVQNPHGGHIDAKIPPDYEENALLQNRVLEKGKPKYFPCNVGEDQAFAILEQRVGEVVMRWKENKAGIRSVVVVREDIYAGGLLLLKNQVVSSQSKYPALRIPFESLKGGKIESEFGNISIEGMDRIKVEKMPHNFEMQIGQDGVRIVYNHQNVASIRKIGDELEITTLQGLVSTQTHGNNYISYKLVNLAMNSLTNGGIDLNTSNMLWKDTKDGRGVEMNVDPAMIERVRREGIDSLSPVVFRITPITNIWPLVGLQAPA